MMEKKLTDAQTRALMALIRERDEFLAEINKAIDELVMDWGEGQFQKPLVRGGQGGLYIMEAEDAQDQRSDTDVEE
jgi:ribosomal 50S subunit-associated protein YjgA (DUF615 family)